jgi:uncharacterized membrane protein
VRYADINNFMAKMGGLELDRQDLSSDDNVKRQHLEALNEMYADGRIDEDQYQEMLTGSFGAAERSDQFSTAL